MLSRFRSRLQKRSAGRIWPFAAGALRTVVEAGWLTAFYAAASVLADKQAPVLGPLEMSAFVGAGVLIGALGRRQAAIGAVVLIGGVLVGGALGSLAGQGPSALADNWQQALGTHIAGWLAGVAVLRGAVVRMGDKMAEQLERMLRVVPVAIGILWAYATYAARPELWQPFWIGAMWGTALYLSGSLVAIGMARLNVLHAEVTDVRQRRAWRWLVFLIGFAILPATVPLALLAGIPVAAILAPIVGPLQWLLTLLAYPLAFIIWILSILLGPIAGPLAEVFDELARRGPLFENVETQSSEIATAVAFLITAATVLLIAAAIYFVAHWLLTRRQPPPDDPESTYADIERSIVLPPAAPPAAPGRARRPGRPRDAVGAYVAAIAELDGHELLARRSSETPAAHAIRIKPHQEARGPDFARLAAAYQLARYASRPITRLENVRGLARFERIRRALRRL